MAELSNADVVAYTNGQLADDDTTTRLLAAALAAARRYCGWHVSPVTDEEVEIDGPGDRVLSLPTRCLIGISSVTECGDSLDVDKLDWSRRLGVVQKYPYGWWTSRMGAITVEMTHGYTEEEAVDFREAVLRMVVMSSNDAGNSRDDQSLVRKKVDDVEYQWTDAAISADDRLASLFSAFRILQSP